jgi:3-methylfumaryl-CoA hydratase
MKHDFSELKKAVGNTSPLAIETASAAPVARLAATFGIDIPARAAGDILPVGWHGLYFGSLHGPGNMRPDGQFISSSWMPVVPLAHYRLGRDDAEYPGDIRIGDELTRISTITDVSTSGPDDNPLLHITQRSEISGPRGLVMIEERESLYFDGDRPVPGPAPALPEPRWKKVVPPDSVLMFRYSAVRFNCHRIHYDRDFATKVEGLPGLVVQATLTAQLSLELCRTALPGKRIVSYKLFNRHPTYDTGPFTICGSPGADETVAMWTLDSEGSVAQWGEIRFDA